MECASLPSGLWVVASPIGNLGDLTPRALQALRQADVVLCEDTRWTAQLMSACGIEGGVKKLKRFQENQPSQRVHWLERLQQGQSLALVTDAGTPGISDPGQALVAQAHQAGIRVVPIVGASALSALLSVSGFTKGPVLFFGFFPRKRSEQDHLLKQMKSFSGVGVWFESPLRILKTFQRFLHEFPDAPAFVGKELTKVHEQLFQGSVQDLWTRLQQVPLRGEWCFALSFQQKEKKEIFAWSLALECLKENGCSLSHAVASVSQKFHLPRSSVYRTALSIFNEKKEKLC